MERSLTDEEINKLQVFYEVFGQNTKILGLYSLSLETLKASSFNFLTLYTVGGKRTDGEQVECCPQMRISNTVAHWAA